MFTEEKKKVTAVFYMDRKQRLGHIQTTFQLFWLQPLPFDGFLAFVLFSPTTPPPPVISPPFAIPDHLPQKA